MIRVPDGGMRAHHSHGRHEVDDHDLHDHDDDVQFEDNPIWQQDNVFLTSVGIDVGSSGTQVVFSRLHLRRMGEALASRYVVVERIRLHQSPVTLTPFLDEHSIDAEQLGRIIDTAYADAGLGPGDVDTGVVILTGEALRRRNAERITGLLAERAGDLICASAGHNMEARLAAHGSGAVQRSMESGTTILNVDIGGGTTKLAVIESGEVTSTGAIHVGGRLLVVDEDGRIVRLEAAGREHALRAGFDWVTDQVIDIAHLTDVGASMAEFLDTSIFEPERVPAASAMFLTDPVRVPPDLDGVLVSGGVAEYFYGREDRHFGDLGPHLGRAFMERLRARKVRVAEPDECIRATVLGASEYTVQLSGNTAWIEADPGLLPRRNLQVLRPRYDLPDTIDPAAVSLAIANAFQAFDRKGGEGSVALALRWSGLPLYERLRRFAEGICEGMREELRSGNSLYIVLDGDIAMSLGRILHQELDVTAGLVVVDGVHLQEFDYIDLGRVRQPSGTVAVTIKSLVFERPMERTTGHAIPSLDPEAQR
jgi:ethanolamine utilization protein EutA